MSNARIIILIVFGFIKLSQAQIDLDRNGYDTSLTNLDRISKNNTNITESPTQYLINWGEIPTNLKGIKKIVEYVGDYCLPDSTTTSELVMIDGAIRNINLDKNTQFIREFYEHNDSVIIDSYRIFLEEEDGILKENTFFLKDKYIYVNDTLKESIRSSGSRAPNWKYSYYSSGNLKEIRIDSFFRLTSRILGDTIVYQSHYDYYVSNGIISDIDNYPSVLTKMFKTINDSCYCYQNYVNSKPLSPINILNKEFTQCRNGKIINEKRWNQKNQYKTIAQNDSFYYEGIKLISKLSNIEHENGFQQINYFYNKQGYLIEMKDNHKGRKYLYDKRGNIIRIINYWLDTKEIIDIRIRHIMYRE